MYPPGHVAVAWLTASVTGSERGWRMLFVVLGALLPDLIDKALWVSGLVPGTRGVGHSLLLWCALGLLALWGGTPRLVAVGGWSHLVADVLDDALCGVFSTGTVITGWLAWPMPAAQVWLGWSSAPVPYWGARFAAEVVVVCVVLVSVGLRALSERRDPRGQEPPSGPSL